MKLEEILECDMEDRERYLKYIIQAEIDEREADIKYEKQQRQTDVMLGNWYGRLFVCGPDPVAIRERFDYLFEDDPEILIIFEASILEHEQERAKLGFSVEEYRVHWEAIDQAELDLVPKTVALFHGEDVIVARNEDGRLVFKVRANDDKEGVRATEIAGDATTNSHFTALALAHGAEAISNEWDWEFESHERLDPSIPLDLH